MARTSKSRGAAAFTMRSGNKPSVVKMAGVSPFLIDPTDPKDKSVSEKQTIVDKKNIKDNTNQPLSSADNYKDTVKSTKRQNRINTQNMSRKEIQKELKERKRQGVNKSEKLDVGLLGRVFSGKKKLASKLAHQKNVSDI